MMEGNHIYWAHTCSRYWIRPLISVISFNSHNSVKYEFSTVYRRGNRIRLNDLPKATQLENGGRRLWVQTSITTKFIHFYLEQGKKLIPLNEDWYISAMLMRQGWLQWYQCRCERNTAGMSKTVLSETRDNTGKVGLQTSTAVMSDRTVCGDGNVLCQPCPTWQPLTTLAMQQVQCAGGGVYGETLSQPFLTAWIPFPSCLPDEQGSLYQLLVFFLRVNCSLYSCKCGVYVGGEEFRIFLRGRLKPEPSPAISKCHCPAFWPP